MQVDMHKRKVQEVFGQTPHVFRNTELAYNNDVAHWADKAGYKGILAEGWDPILDWRSPNYVYRPTYTDNIRQLEGLARVGLLDAATAQWLKEAYIGYRSVLHHLSLEGGQRVVAAGPHVQTRARVQEIMARLQDRSGESAAFLFKALAAPNLIAPAPQLLFEPWQRSGFEPFSFAE